MKSRLNGVKDRIFHKHLTVRSHVGDLLISTKTAAKSRRQNYECCIHIILPLFFGKVFFDIILHFPAVVKKNILGRLKKRTAQVFSARLGKIFKISGNTSLTRNVRSR